MKKGKHLIGILFNIVFMMVSLTGCGDEVKQTGEQADESIEYVYTAKTIPLCFDSDKYVNNVSFLNDHIYYIIDEKTMDPLNSVPSVMYTIDLLKEDPEPEEYQVINNDQYRDGYTNHPGDYIVTKDGYLLGTICGYREVENQTLWDSRFLLCKKDKNGDNFFNININEYLEMDPYNKDVECLFEDKKGNIFLSNGCSYIWIFDKDGSPVISIKPDGLGMQGNYIHEFGCTKDGKACYLSINLDEHAVRVYNDTKKEFSEAYNNLPSDCFNPSISAGLNSDVLLCGNDALYDYDFKTQSYEELLKWADVSLEGNSVRDTYVLSDGKIAVFYQNTSLGENSVIILEKIPVTEKKDKKIITLSGMSISTYIQSQVTKFNKISDEYQIQIVNYGDAIDWSLSSAYSDYNDAMIRFHNDLVSGTASDMFLASEMDLDMYASKGVIEDLTPYLEKSSKISKEDFIQPVLDAFTVRGKLCTIPVRFGICTIFGRTSELGEESGWTMSDMLKFAEKYSDRKIFPYACNTILADYCLIYDCDSYVNWESGECNFYSDDFKMMLELAKSYPSGMYVDYDIPEAKSIRKKEASLSVATLFSPKDWQIMSRMFEEPITAIGFPSSNSSGVVVRGEDGICINASSKNKDAAWKFIEGLFTEDFKCSNAVGYQTKKEWYDKELKEAMIPEYKLDKEGNQVLDEAGNPIEVPQGSVTWGDALFAELYAVTQDEADSLWKVIEHIDGMECRNNELVDIVNEELIPYFDGQKDLEEVLNIIQSRVQLYVSERK